MTREEAVEVLKERYLTCVGIGLDNHANRVNEAIDMAIEALSGKLQLSEETPTMKVDTPTEPTCKKCTDLISRADAIELLTEIVFDEPPYFDSETLCRLYAEEQINTLPSAEIAETEPIVIRSKTLLPTKDFKEWAKRIKEVNPNAVVIPCDAEVASADAVQGEWKHTITAQPYCSNCEYVFGEDEEFSPFWNYCPMCGARMKGGAE